ncbi:MAG: carboxypeptidase-like regulatory domain-containing protein [Prevotella sp.]|nr:carboxypeptidase-like regulatory domain-containing protein [Prevotella sp.]MBQ9223373.1 carboxypeptidase-like regulatory domain-containing protein [Prevotella sp.]
MKRTILTLLVMSLFTMAFAQRVRVTFSIKDATGAPVIGASIVEKGTTNGAVADFEGNLVIWIEMGKTVVITFVGYESQELVVTQTHYDIILNEGSEDLDKEDKTFFITN